MPVRVVPHPGPQQRARVQHFERLEEVVVGFVAHRVEQSLTDLESDARPQVHDVGVAAQQRGRDGGREFGLVGDQQCDAAQHLDDAGGPVVGDRLVGRHRRQPAPEHLRDQVFLRREVGVGRGRRHPGLLRHQTNGQSGEPVLA